MHLRRLSILFIAISVILIAGCAQPGGNSEGAVYQHVDSDDCFGDLTPARTFETDTNPSISLNEIFSTDSVGFTTITIRRSEWNKMLSYYDYFYKNENSVLAESYKYEKGGETWELKGVGMRLRGNTSRYRPQGKDHKTDESGHTQYNYSWNKGYYDYAANCDDNDYRQSHFKIDFEPYSNDDRKMAGGMKGVALKRSDSLFSSEIFCYYLFHQYGIWTAPRASQTHVTIDIIEDVSEGTVAEDISTCSTTSLNYGVYEMFEEVNKQSLKSRASKNNAAGNAWKNNNGDLWKCSGGDLTAKSNVSDKFGYEQVEILHTSKPKDQWSWVWYAPCYDLKTNKTNVSSATAYFRGFISELNNLSNKSASTEEGIAARKAFYEKWFDVDFFIKTYAVNILVGMDDDYWGNANNYYLYFDNGKNGSGKCYFIPFDYDNTLGKSIKGDKVYWDPFKWGYNEDQTVKNDRPLLDRLLEVPEYKEKFRQTLLEVSSQDSTSPWNRDKNIALWAQWKTQVEPYVNSSDLSGYLCETSFYDYGGWKNKKHYLTQESDNIYEQVTTNLKYWLKDDVMQIKFDLNGGSINGQTGTVTVTYQGQASYSDMITQPVREGYIFQGWTKTKNNSDFVYSYLGEDDITVYANWFEVTSSAAINVNFGQFSNEVSIAITAKDDGLHITKSNSTTYNHVNMQIKDETTGKELLALDNIDRSGNNYLTDFVYPFVENNHIYKLVFEFMDNDYNNYHSADCMIKAAGGSGDKYISITGYTYDKENKTITLHGLDRELGDKDSNAWAHSVGMFTNYMWEGGEGLATWDYAWKIVSETSNSATVKIYKIDKQNGKYSDEESDWFDNKSNHYLYLGIEFGDGVSTLRFRTPLIQEKVWPN